MTDIIKTQKLSKHFPGVQAVEDLSLNIREGEIYGFLGLNGAGKTTTIRILLGLIQPTSGACFIHGKQVGPGNKDIWKDIGYLVEIPYSYPELTVRENLEIIRRMRFIPEKKSVDKIIEKLHLGEYADRKSKNLSHGNSQRLGLAKALIHHPRNVKRSILRRNAIKHDKLHHSGTDIHYRVYRNRKMVALCRSCLGKVPNL